jgi:hypothetical protein
MPSRPWEEEIRCTQRGCREGKMQGDFFQRQVVSSSVAYFVRYTVNAENVHNLSLYRNVGIEWLAFLITIRWVLSSDIGANLTEVLRDFLSPCRQMSGQYLKSGHNHFHPNVDILLPEHKVKMRHKTAN